MHVEAAMRFLPILPCALLVACVPTPPPDVAPSAAAWNMVSSGAGSALHLTAGGARQVLLFCPAGQDRLLVNVPAFLPVGSEERMALGAGGTVVTLVADPAGDPLRGGVSGAAPVPVELAAILGDRVGVAVNYGYQNAGPFPAVPAELRADFLEGCAG